MQVDIAIVGAGPVGLALASALVNDVDSLVVLDAREGPGEIPAGQYDSDNCHLNSHVSPRVSAINPASGQWLDQLGAWTALPMERTGRFESMEVWDGEGTGSLTFPARGSIVENVAIESALLSVLPEGTVRWNLVPRSLRATGQGYCLDLDDGSTLTCELLVGADGANSFVREQCEFSKKGWRYDQQAIVSTVQTQLPHEQVARQVFLATGPVALLPLADPHLCSLVWSTTDAPMLLELGDSGFCQALGRASEHCLGEVLASDQRFSFPLQQQHALTYAKPGVVLIGDAAHSIHPLAGQGVNLGFADARALFQEIKSARLEDGDIGAIRSLRRYQAKRQPDNMAMAGLMEALYRLFGQRSPAFTWLRSAGMRLLDDNEYLKTQLVRAASR